MVLLRENIMKQQLLKEIELGSKNALIKKRIITHYIYNGSSTITDLSKELDLSIPTVTKFIGEMYEDGYINDYGKLETSGGRHPSLYGLNPESGYFIGVDIKRFAVNIGLINFKGDMMELKMNIPYKFENTPEAKEDPQVWRVHAQERPQVPLLHERWRLRDRPAAQAPGRVLRPRHS